MPTPHHLVAKADSGFEDWLGARRPVYLSTNAGTDEIPFQNWRKFKEAFAPELIAQAYEETSAAIGREVKNCLDPFGGSGTTALASQFLGVHPTTVEINPFLADLIEAKLWTYDIDQLITDFSEVMDVDLGDVLLEDPFPGAPASFVAPGLRERYLFSRAVASALGTLRKRIEQVPSADNRRLFRVLLGATSLSVSNVLVSGKGRRYRSNWQAAQSEPTDVWQAFETAVVRAIYDIKRHQDRKSGVYTIIRGDSRQVSLRKAHYDLVVFSPPYPNSFDYTDVYNVELWVCGYLRSKADNRALREATLRSHVQIARPFDCDRLPSVTLERVQAELAVVKGTLWNRHIPAMVNAYFADMAKILGSLRASLRPGGRIYMVVGDSRYGGVRIPVSDILVDIVTQQQFRVLAQEPFRSMHASPQQGGRPELVESLITLSV